MCMEYRTNKKERKYVLKKRREWEQNERFYSQSFMFNIHHHPGDHLTLKVMSITLREFLFTLNIDSSNNEYKEKNSDVKKNGRFFWSDTNERNT
jgi:hypothetical protein